MIVASWRADAAICARPGDIAGATAPVATSTAARLIAILTRKTVTAESAGLAAVHRGQWLAISTPTIRAAGSGDMKISASATVVLTIEISAAGSYGTEWKLSDLHTQVAKEAEQTVRALLPGVRIHGAPKVRCCTFEVEK